MRAVSFIHIEEHLFNCLHSMKYNDRNMLSRSKRVYKPPKEFIRVTVGKLSLLVLKNSLFKVPDVYWQRVNVRSFDLFCSKSPIV